MPQRAETDTIQLKARMKEPLRAKLETAAEAKGVSLNAEMVDRLEASFAKEEELGGARDAALFRMLANAAALIQQQTGKDWQEDWDTAQTVQHAWGEIIMWAASRVRRPQEIEEFLEMKRPQESGERKTLAEELMEPKTLRSLAELAGMVEPAEAEVQKHERLAQLLEEEYRSWRTYFAKAEAYASRVERHQEMAVKAVLATDLSGLRRSE